MAEIIQGSKSSVLEQKVNQYEMAMKDKFVRIMSQPGIKYADALDYIDNELKQSKKMAKINYRIRCFRNDGIYQLNQAISQVFGAVVSKGIHLVNQVFKPWTLLLQMGQELKLHMATFR